MASSRDKILYVGGNGVVPPELFALCQKAGYVLAPAQRAAGDAAGKRAARAIRVQMVHAGRSTVRRGRDGKAAANETVTVPMTLRALRESVGRTQGEVARKVSMTQPQLSRVEARRDHLISTLRKYIRALGGEIEVVALVKGTRVSLRDV
jgi:hypothetical protein